MEENLIIEGTNKTPVIKFYYENGAIEISGKSIPENSIGFYQPIYSWIDNYATKPSPKTEIKINLEYFNTSSSKCLLDIFRKFESIKKAGKSDIEVLWHYEADDEDMMEAGDDYNSLVDLTFRLIKV